MISVAKGWARAVQSQANWTVGFYLIGGFIPGCTILRTHFSWGFEGVSPLTEWIGDTQANLQVFGLCTTVGDGGGPPPNPREHPFDVDPPSQRWLWWEARAPRVRSVDGVNGLVVWSDSGAQYPTDTHGMVSGKTVPAGQTLNIWASWASAYAWPDDGYVNVWFSASVLVEIPE